MYVYVCEYDIVHDWWSVIWIYMSMSMMFMINELVMNIIYDINDDLWNWFMMIWCCSYCDIIVYALLELFMNIWDIDDLHLILLCHVVLYTVYVALNYDSYVHYLRCMWSLCDVWKQCLQWYLIILWITFCRVAVYIY